MSWQFSSPEENVRVGFVPAGKVLPAGSCTYDSKMGWNLTPSARSKHVGQGIEHPLPAPAPADNSLLMFGLVVVAAGLLGLMVAIPVFARSHATRAVF